ncbi:MAG: transporter [Gallionellales bacterium 35-53-114]|jgi:predicted lipid-binding transport protein (Tim44 family)|nr:MAG: transporter [Gallionellales bacterium 35-53-114]OYZ63593.1 MAG: transporter [Gallionellales bacterium 24-53-125]OZB10797.1 MAG: transporter [Gallionellales bacterium 39-52-133]HQS59034.1 Tim44-like domain-containing protein [Gallionellaceae bacterium]HQS75581.1 Tim44-like domain-containing protein [Gallionellaceae bacterium]
MKRFLLVLTIALSSLTLLAANAEAKRMGGGGSFGKQRSMSPQQMQKAPAAAPAPAAAGAAAPAAGNKWMGPLAGLAIGAGLGALFAGGLGGLGGGFGGILMMLALAALAFFLFSKFRKSQQPAMQYAGQGAPFSQPETQAYSGGGAVAAPTAKNIPADFPVEAFLRSAKMSFIRLQAANDRKDLNDIREYTTPEMFAEISMQLQERGNAAQTSDVINLNADLLEVVTENNHAIASVRMTGQIAENKGTPENFDEIWHVQKDLQNDKAVWLLSGIQQVA